MKISEDIENVHSFHLYLTYTQYKLYEGWFRLMEKLKFTLHEILKQKSTKLTSQQRSTTEEKMDEIFSLLLHSFN